MNYYKIIIDNQLIGAVSSKNFIRYIPIANCFERCSEAQAEYISYLGNLYRDTWMPPTSTHRDFSDATILPISKTEYDIYVPALEVGEVIEVEEEIQTPSIEELALDIEWMQNIKIEQMSKACRKTIENGFDIELRGETKHFSLNTQDQLNLMSLAQMAQTQSMLPYHADGEEVVFYAAEEIQQLVDEMNAFKIYHTTYYNALKAYIKSLLTVEEISAVEYGMEIPEEYKTDVLKALE